MILVAVCALLGCAWNVPFHPDALPLIIGLNAALFAIAAVGYRALGAVASRRPEVVVFLVLVAVDGAIVALGLGHEALGLLAVGYLLLLPVVVSLMIPWATAVHVRWLGGHVMFALVLLLFATDGTVAGADRDQLLGLLVVAIVVSQTGHVKGVRGQVAAFTQIQQIRALNRAARRDHARLDRLLAVTAEAAVTDPLTGLGNRLALTTAFELARSRIERHRDSYGLLMLDLDGFKAINDERGHRAGDEVLQAVAHAIRRVLRPGDHAFRYGGEEFVVLLRLDRAGDALAVAERVRQAVEDLAIPNAGNLPFGHLTISVGVTAFGPNEGPAVEEMWLARADAALYRAKSTGRNRCETGTAEVSSSVARISSIPEDRSSGAEGALVVGVPSTVGAEG
jgi:diguanylate cyclase (GGDEF)-like protein